MIGTLGVAVVGLISAVSVCVEMHATSDVDGVGLSVS